MKLHLPLSLLAALSLIALPGCGNDRADGATHSQDDEHAMEGGDMPTIDAAVARVVAIGDGEVSGVVRFERTDGGVAVTGEIRGLTPGDHGFHVHEFGDLSDIETGESAGGHFSPEGHEHGRPEDEQRHAGDLGNVTANDEGVATIDITDSVLALDGEHSILGRSIVVHRDPDDFGQPTGNAGPRVGVGVIGIAQK